MISFLKDRDLPFWKNFYDFLNNLPIFNRYYRALPPSSYHMTIKNHVSSSSPSYKWEFMKDHTKMIEICKIFDYAPVTKSNKMYSSTSLGLTLIPKDDVNLQKLRSILVVLGMQPEPNFEFHMTFAYRFRKVEKKDEDNLHKEFLSIFDILKVRTEMKFEAARFCYFPNMKEYIAL